MSATPRAPGPEDGRSFPARFGGPAFRYSLSEALETLRASDRPARNGHRQTTTFHRDGLTQVVFAFEPDGHLDRHTAPGLVLIQVLEGRFVLHAEETDHDMTSGDVLILDPGVPHSVRAVEAGAMLLTVRLER